MSFRKKIITSQVISFVIFLAVLFPLIDQMAARLIKDSLIESMAELKGRLQQAKSEKELLHIFQQQGKATHLRSMLISDKGIMISDTTSGAGLGSGQQTVASTLTSQIQEAMQKGVGYAIAPSRSGMGRSAYVTQALSVQGRTYILQTAFPYQQVEDLTENFQIGISLFTFFVLLFFNALILLTFNRLTRPIREIIGAIRSGPSGSGLPEIKLTGSTNPTDDFPRLAEALNSLSRAIGEKIDDLKAERDEKGIILESLTEGVVAVDGQMKILYINSTACDMLGVHRPNVLRRDFGAKGAMVNEGLSQKARQLLALCHTQDATVTNSHACDQKGSLMYIDLIAIPKAQGKGAILVLQDKTESHRLVEMGKDFVANASHELRTPITIIQGYAETLRDFPDVPRAQYVEITEKISRNCERMETLVKSLLTLADIDHLSDKRLIETDLSTLVVNSRHIFRSAYPDITVTIDAPFKQEMLVEADPSLLELALVNLLENAAKYSEPPAQITVSLQPQSEAEVVIQVADHGRGIPQGDLAHIFQRFYRVDKSHSRRLGGAGLGLSIVKTIIDKHRGTIRVKSTLGQGTTFTMTLPRLPVVKKGQK